MNFQLKTLPLLLLLSSCNYFFTPDVHWGDRERMNNKDAKSFEMFYKGNPNPPIILENDYKGYLKLMKDKEYADVKDKLVKYFGYNYQLWTYYFMDMDGDKIYDWQWNDDDKIFIAIDQDIDNDGIDNIFDADPYSSFILNNDSDNDNIPNHLDWDLNNDNISDVKNISNNMAALQKTVFDSVDIIAVNQDTLHNARTIKTFHEVIKLGYGEVLSNNNGKFPEVKYLVAQKGKEDSRVLAWFRGVSKMITIEDLGREEGTNEVFPGITPLPFYATIIHELAHAHQKHIKNRDHKDTTYIEFLGHSWNDSSYKGKTRSEWNDLLDAEIDNAIDNYKESDNITDINYCIDLKSKTIIYAETKVAKENNIISKYSLKSPNEYYAESVATYVMKLILEKRFVHLRPEAKERVMKRLRKKILIATKLGLDNLRPEGVSFIEKELKLNEKLFFNREFKHKNGLYGRWERKQ